MSEWNVHGNRSERFPRWMMSPPLQDKVDAEVAQDRLREILPEQCQNCLKARMVKIKPLAVEVVKDMVTKEAAIEEIGRFSEDCPGMNNDNYYTRCPSLDRAEQEEEDNGNV